MPCPTGAVSIWQAEGNAQDSVGTNNGTLLNGTGFTTGKVGAQAFDLDGVDDIIDVGPCTDIGALSAISISVWVKVSAAELNDTLFTIISNTDGNSDGFALRIDSWSGTGHLNERRVQFLVNGSTNNSITSTVNAFNLDVWNHVVGTYDNATGASKVYANGVDVTESFNPNPGNYGASPWNTRIGALVQGTNGFPYSFATSVLYAGAQIDQLGVYDHVLTPTEVTDLYNGGAGLECPAPAICPATPISIWKMDGNYNDSVGTNHGTPVGSPAFIPGIIGAGQAVDTLPGHVDVPDDPSLNPPNFAVSFWTKPNGYGGFSTAIMKSTNSNFNDGWGFYQDSANQMRFWVSSYNINFVTASVPAGVWSHLVGQFDGVNVEFFVNGVSQGTDPLASYTPTSNRIIFGKYPLGPTSAGGTYNGELDQIEFFDRALNPTEISDLYNGGAGLDCPVISLPDCPPNAVSIWKAEGDATDSVGSNDGVLGGGTTFATGHVAGGQAFSFDGAGSYVDAGSDPSLDLSEVSISAWVKPNGPHTGAAGGIVDMAVSGTTENYSLLMFDSGNLLIQYYNGGWQSLVSTTAIPNGVWSHVVATIDGSGVKSFYIDGSPDNSSAPGPPMLIDTNNVLHIGEYAAGTGGFLSGDVDQVEIFGRILTPTEITDLYNNGFGLDCPDGVVVECPPDAVNIWKAEGNALDSVGSNDGTLVNGATFAPGHVAGGQAFSFDGSGDDVNCGAYTFPDELSISAWINPDILGGFRAICGVHDAATNTNSENIYIDSSGRIGWQSASPFSSNWKEWLTVETVSTSTWTHIVLTQSDPNTAPNIYINGVGATVNSGANNGIITRVSETFHIGRANGSDFDGLIDQVEVYSRELTPTEATDLYNGGAGLDCPSGPPVINADPSINSATPSVTFSNNPTLTGAKENIAFTVDVSATDPDGGADITSMVIDNLPAGWGQSTVLDAPSGNTRTGTITVTPDYDASADPAVILNVKVSDASTANDTFPLTSTVVANDAPVMTPIANPAAILEGTSNPDLVDANATDANGHSLEFAIDHVEQPIGTTIATPAWITINSANGKVSIDPPNGTAGDTYRVCVKVKDGNF